MKFEGPPPQEESDNDKEKRFSSVSRILGARNKEDEEKAWKFYREIFEKPRLRIDNEYRENEKLKTLEEEKLITLANEISNRIVRKYGGEEIDLGDKHVVITKFEGREEGDDITWGFFAGGTQLLSLQEQPKGTTFLKTMIHEMVHYKSFNSVSLEGGVYEKCPVCREDLNGTYCKNCGSENVPDLTTYRCGLRMYSPKNSEGYFRVLNEAVTEELAVEGVKEGLEEAEVLRKEKGKRDKFIEELRKVNPPDELLESVVYGEHLEVGDDALKDGRYNVLENEDGSGMLLKLASYPTERKILSRLTEKILEKNSDRYNNKKEVFDEFARAMISGGMLPLGRLVDGTFGKGTLRKIGELDSDIEALEEFIKSL